MTIGGGVISRPAGSALLPGPSPITATEASAANRTGIRRIHQTREDPFRLLLVIGRNIDIVLSRILAPFTKGRKQGTCACHQRGYGDDQPPCALHAGLNL